MNERKGVYPLQEAGDRYDAAENLGERLAQDVVEARKILEGLVDPAERQQAERLLEEIQQEWREAMVARGEAAKQMEQILKEQGEALEEEHILDLAGAFARAESATQAVVVAQRAAAEAVADLKSAVESPVTDDERAVVREQLAGIVSDEELGLSRQMRTALEGRVARWMREGDLDGDDLRDRVLASAKADREASAPRAWGDQTWHVS